MSHYSVQFYHNIFSLPENYYRTVLELAELNLEAKEEHVQRCNNKSIQ